MIAVLDILYDDTRGWTLCIVPEISTHKEKVLIPINEIIKKAIEKLNWNQESL